MRRSDTVPDWTERAACLGYDPDVWFPKAERSERGRTALAKTICSGCPVALQCLQVALDERLEGVWGGTTENERAAMRRRGAA